MSARTRAMNARPSWRQGGPVGVSRVRIGYPSPIRLASALGMAGADGWRTTPGLWIDRQGEHQGLAEGRLQLPDGLKAGAELGMQSGPGDRRGAGKCV
jgi:hypothetical protein